jgi:hypothetical protein
MIEVAVVLVAWVVIGVSAAHAVIGPVDGTGQPVPDPPVTAAIFDENGTDITNAWLPAWRPPPAGQPIADGGTPVYVVFQDATGASIVPSAVTLVRPTATQASAAAFTGLVNPFQSPLSTSAYPGQCTNYGSPSDFSDDFAFDTTGTLFTGTDGAPRTGFRLIPLDCGGMAVVTATVDGLPYTFVLPQSSSPSGIPDIWAAAFCPPTSPCPTGREDADSSPGNAVNGDGIFAFDEYRGFIVSGVQVRTDPGRKDLFLHLVNPQCVPGDPLASTASLFGGPNSIVSGAPLFANLDVLLSQTQVHRLGYATPNAPHLTTSEWVDRFARFALGEGLRFGDGTLTIAPADDRQVNQNAVYFNVNTAGIKIPQKGVRVIECLDTSLPSLLGFASLGSPNGNDNAIIYTQRIVNYFTTTLNAVCATPDTACLRYSTFRNGAWTAPVPISPLELFRVAFAFYVGHEVGHSAGPLTPTIQSARRTSYGYHHAPGSGSTLDQAITNKVTSQGNTFYIPSLYNTSDFTGFKLK